MRLERWRALPAERRAPHVLVQRCDLVICGRVGYECLNRKGTRAEHSSAGPMVIEGRLRSQRRTTPRPPVMLTDANPGVAPWRIDRELIQRLVYGGERLLAQAQGQLTRCDLALEHGFHHAADGAAFQPWIAGVHLAETSDELGRGHLV
jgi:hypothetical protein